DEHFPVYLEVMKHQVTHDIGWDNPLTFFNSAKTKNDLTSFVKNKSGLSGNFNNIGLVMKERYDAYLKTVPYKVYSVKSRPLYMMVKDMNKFSYNYPPEVLFAKLGGLTAYSSFIAQRLKLVTSDVEMYNGSGYPIMVNGDKKYNQVSCASIVMVLKDLDLFLTTYKGSRSFEMADVMAVGGPGESYSTFKGLYGGGTYNNTLTAKTGSADRAITFGGMLSTKDGDLYFAVLTSPDNYSNPDVSNARILIRSLVQTLVERNQLKKFSYKQIGNMKAFDEQSALVEEKVATKIATSLK
ncbi:MAG TPA: D-alanyl-D-alanine carboxypeptidase, partial [Bdellovibrio sp.]|nr:D-alanyl-D-alanine carboxypeptidase [Bdellovibrio sp.]